MAPTTTPRRGDVQFTAPLKITKFAASGDPDKKGRWTMRGLTAVFNQRSHDLGGFRTEIDPAFFDEILATEPDVHLVRDHDMRFVLGRTRNGTLEFTKTDEGLAVWALFPKTSIAEDTAAEMADGYIDQMSFACDIGEDVWYEDADGTIVRRLLNCAGLYDATICAQGAFPQTSSHLAASLSGDGAELLASAKEAGRVTTRDAAFAARPTEDADENHSVAPSEGGAATVADEEGRGGRDLAANPELTELQKWAEARFSAAPIPT